MTGPDSEEHRTDGGAKPRSDMPQLDADSLRALLQERRQQKIEEAAGWLLDEGAEKDLSHEDLEARLAWLAASSRLLDTMETPLSGWALWVSKRLKTSKVLTFLNDWKPLFALGVAGLCVALAGYLWGARLSEVNVLMHVETDEVTLGLAGPWRSNENLSAGYIKIAGLSNAEVPVLGLHVEDDFRNVQVEMQASRVSIDQLAITPLDTLLAPDERFSNLSFNAKGRELEILSTGNHLRGDVTLLGETVLSLGSTKKDTLFDFLEKAAFGSDGQGAVPTHFTILQRDTFQLQGMKIRDLSFLQRYSPVPGSVRFRSAITAGTVTVLDIPSDSLVLRGGDRVALTEPLEAERLEIAFGEGIHLLFKGKVKNVRVGPEGFERSLTPSQLEYWYHNEPGKMFWGAVVFLYGLLWSLPKLFLAKAS